MNQAQACVKGELCIGLYHCYSCLSLLNINFSDCSLLTPSRIFRMLHMTVWPSGLRRWLQAPIRKGVGSNPTAVTLLAMLRHTLPAHQLMHVQHAPYTLSHDHMWSHKHVLPYTSGVPHTCGTTPAESASRRPKPPANAS